MSLNESDARSITDGQSMLETLRSEVDGLAGAQLPQTGGRVDFPIKRRSSRMNTVLVVEDDPDMARVIRTELEHSGLTVTHVADGQSGLEVALLQEFAVVVVDVNLPRKNGFDICREVRTKKPLQPILMLTSRSDEFDKVLGFELGADDYLTKPFSPKEFLARVRALMRRSQATLAAAAVPEELRFGALLIDTLRRRVTYEGRDLNLTAIEYDLLYFLAIHAGQPFTRDDLMQHVWGYSSSGFDPTVTTQLSRLRAKIEPNPAKPTFVLTVRGVGYRFVEPQEL